jgi:hypothetical protein
VGRRLVPLITTAVIVLVGCGGDGDGGLPGEDSVRDCLAGAGLRAAQPAGSGGTRGYAPLSGAVPDFVLYADDGTSVGVSVYGTGEKAERAAADLSGAIQSLGGADRREVESEGNVVVVFGATPSEQTRQAVDDCLD